MSREISTLPPQLQEQLARLQQLQQTLQVVVAQKQQLELERSEIERALGELEKMSDDAVIYKSIGSILVKVERQKMINELRERDELLNTRVVVLSRQQKRAEERINELQKSLQARLRAT